MEESSPSIYRDVHVLDCITCRKLYEIVRDTLLSCADVQYYNSKKHMYLDLFDLKVTAVVSRKDLKQLFA